MPPTPLQQTALSEPASAVETTPRLKGRLSLRRLAQLALGVGALALVLAKAEPRGLMDAVTATRVHYLPLAIAASLAVTWLMAARWRLILEVRGYRPATRRLFSYYLIGIFFSNCVPGGSVSLDVARLIYAAKEIPDKAFIVSTLVFERVVGLFAVLLTGLCATLAARAYLPNGRGVYAVETALASVFVISASLLSDAVSTRVVRFVSAAGSRLRVERVSDALVRVVEAIAEMRGYRGMIARTVLVSLVIRVVWSAGCFIVAKAMQLPVELPLVFAFISIYDLIRMLPITVNGIGLREWALVALFANVGVGREQALMFSFLAFAPIMLNAIAGGVIYLLRAGRNAGASKEEPQ